MHKKHQTSDTKNLSGSELISAPLNFGLKESKDKCVFRFIIPDATRESVRISLEESRLTITSNPWLSENLHPEENPAIPKKNVRVVVDLNAEIKFEELSTIVQNGMVTFCIPKERKPDLKIIERQYIR